MNSEPLHRLCKLPGRHEKFTAAELKGHHGPPLSLERGGVLSSYWGNEALDPRVCGINMSCQSLVFSSPMESKHMAPQFWTFYGLDPRFSQYCCPEHDEADGAITWDICKHEPSSGVCATKQDFSVN